MQCGHPYKLDVDNHIMMMMLKNVLYSQAGSSQSLIQQTLF